MRFFRGTSRASGAASLGGSVVRAVASAGLGLSVLFSAVSLSAQNNQTSATNSYYGSATISAVTPDVIQLSLDDAIVRGLEHNLALELAKQNQGAAHAQSLGELAPMLPTVNGTANYGVHQYNLAAEGFKPGIIAGSPLGNLPLIQVVTVLQAQANYSQSLFDVSQYMSYRSAQASEKAAFYNTQSSRGLVVLTVGTTYLRAVAAASEVENARALLRTDETLLYQAQEMHKAGVVANLDELRARVTYQTQQQALIAAENAFEKAKINLNREIGLPAAQKIALMDAAPFQDLATMTLEDARQQAYANRQDYQSIQAQVKAAQLNQRAAKYERLPALSAGGNYGLTGVPGASYHGTFALVGTINFPIFKEAKIRGDQHVAEAQLSNTMAQMADTRSKIDAQLRDSMLDVQTAQELVRVSRSNVELATKTLEQVTDRFQAGIDDNLPVVTAQSTLANAQNQLISSLYKFNQAKLQLARNLGIIDTQYKNFLGR
jgi:outer membrane protein TolC